MQTQIASSEVTFCVRVQSNDGLPLLKETHEKKKQLMKKMIPFCSLLFGMTPALAQAPASAPSTLPVRQVTLFTSGVAYTERGGSVEGDATISLLFRIAQINDILKSMVLLDQTGQVQAATYAARDPASHTLRSFAVDVTYNLTQEDILNRLRGATIALEEPNKPTLTGQIVGVEKRQILAADGKIVVQAVLNLLTETGLTSVRLDTEKTVRLLDTRLNKEFHEALTLLASGTDTQRRQVTLHFAGKGKREVRVGYVLEAPLWKMSYRLLLGEGVAAIGKASKPGTSSKSGDATNTAKPVSSEPTGKPEKSYMQGWALVENTSDDDWQNVRLSLVSGRPVSFIEDLYQPLYLPRPVVGPDVVASPFPQTHDEDLQNAPAAAMPAPGAFGGGGGADGRRSGAMAKSRSSAALGAMGPQGAPGPSGALGEAAADEPANRDSSFRRSVTAQASGQKSGDVFAYKIALPVNLLRQQAAMIPVIAQDVETEKVLLYNPDSGSRFPLNAVRIHNNTGLHLKGGPVTLFDAGIYAGDARMEDIPPGDTRLLSYAVDLAVEGERQGPALDIIESTLSLKRGILTATRRERMETTYTLKSKADKPRTVLVEQPFRAEYHLVAPEKAAERTASVYRFAVTIPPGKSQTLKVVTERPISQTIALFESQTDLLLSYSTRKDISTKLRATLQEVLQRRKKAQDLRAQADMQTAEIAAISSDQERIRKNMMALDKDSALYKRYVTELDMQETRIDALRQEAIKFRAQADAADRDLRVYIENLPAIE